MAFVQRNGTSLTLEGQLFQFLSFNVPNYHIIETPWQRTVASEQRDLAASISMMGGRAFRIYTLSIPESPSDTSRHIIVESGYGTTGVKWKLNEELFQDLDQGLRIASEYNLKVIIPFIDRWTWWGGIPAFAKMYGLTEQDFYSAPAVINGFNSLVKLVLERKNSITGVTYKDDPTIMAWETGNELELFNSRVPDDWTLATSSLIKSLDKNHLVIDGSYGIRGWSDKVLSHPDIDIYSNHYYPQPPWAPMASLFYNWEMVIFGLGAIYITAALIYVIVQYRKQIPIEQRTRWHLTISIVGVLVGLLYLASSRLVNQNYSIRLHNDLDKISTFGKAYLVGEIGVSTINSFSSVFDEFFQTEAVGLLTWSLRGHARNGGFYTHAENGGYFSYHYPGFDSGAGFGSDEKSVFDLYQKLVPFNSKVATIAPVALTNTADGYLRWVGTPGANSYTVEITTPINQTLATGISDGKPAGSGLYLLDDNIKKLKKITIKVTANGKFGSISSNPQEIVVQ